jgi:hypothetical protein
MRLYEFLPVNRAAMRQPPIRRAEADPAPPGYPRPPVHNHHFHAPEPYFRPAEMLGNGKSLHRKTFSNFAPIFSFGKNAHQRLTLVSSERA